MNPPSATNTITPLTMDDSSTSPFVMKRRRSSLTASPSNSSNSCSSHIISATTCSHCGTTTTPLWRRAPNGDTICNACGLYLKTKHTMRPLSTPSEVSETETSTTTKSSCNKSPKASSCGTTSSCEPKQGGSCGGAGQCNGLGGSAACAGCPTFNNQQLRRQQEQQMEGLVCANCRTTTTPLWRRDDQGNTICNACGLYYKLHKVHRPVSMKRNVIKRRKRMVMLEQQQQQQQQQQQHSKPSVEEETHFKGGNRLLPSLPTKTTTTSMSPVKTTNEPHPIKEDEEDDNHSIQSHHTAHSIPAIEDFIGSSRFPIRQQQPQQQPQPSIPSARGTSQGNNNYPSLSLHHHLPLFTMDRSSSSSPILLPPIHSLPTPPSPPLSISSLLSSTTSSPSSSPSSSHSSTSITNYIQRLDHLNQKIANGQYQHHQQQQHLTSFITQLDHLVSQAESTLLHPTS